MKAKITPEIYVKHFKQIGTNNGVARAVGVDERNLRRFIKSHQEEINRLMQEVGEEIDPAISLPEKPSDADIHQRILKSLNKETNINLLSAEFEVSHRVMQAYIDDLTEQGYVIDGNNGILQLRKDIIAEENIHRKDWKGQNIIRFGLCGDNQFGSKWTQITYLHDFYDHCQEEGITDVYHTGDITEGEEMRQGHKYECYVQGADEHLAEVVKNYPRRKGIITHFITGNHDHSLIKRAGYDIGKSIIKEREDMKYLGASNATIYLTPNCTLELAHPIDGTAYALSYGIQKMINEMQGGEKPNILAVGHYHKSEYLPCYRNVHAFQTGCFQAQTPWMRGKKISAMVGAWIVEVNVDKEGTITRCKNEYFPYYRMIKDDYLSWR